MKRAVVPAGAAHTAPSARRAVARAGRRHLNHAGAIVNSAAAAAAFVPLLARAADLNAVNHAVQIASGVGAGTAVPSLGAGAVLQTLVALIVVIGLVFGCAWLARRLGLQPSQRGGIVKTIGGTSLGGKERVAVVEVGDRWLVLGAAPGNVRLLYAMPAGNPGASQAAGAGSPGDPGNPAVGASADSVGGGLPSTFGQRFRDVLKGEAAKRFQRHGSGDR
ncbi:MAG TPA: flagellar biosynthetic protein FliO [Paraburkholderia sp.]|jgi:flagellar protein FliO/FliZ